MKDYYALLGIEPSASPDEVKSAFRRQITRYHPDKVQHLGKEFQDMAADRAAEITEAYSNLSNASLRARYDRERRNFAPGAPTTPSESGGPRGAAPEPASPSPSPPPPSPPVSDARPEADGRFANERAARDEFIRKASIDRFRQVLASTLGQNYTESEVPGFDVARVPKSKWFARAKGPSVLARIVAQVDSEAVADTWLRAAKWDAPTPDETCVFLIGSSLAPFQELSAAIAKQRSGAAGKITLIPVNLRDWKSYVPNDAPDLVKSLLARLKSNT